jgi:hypothetical protein
MLREGEPKGPGRQDEALPLRTASRACCAAVAEHPWSDTGSRVRGSLAQWARCFPKARACNLSYNQAFVDNDAALLQGVRTLDCSYCRGFSSAAFVHLRSLRTLQMAYCSQPELTDGTPPPRRPPSVRGRSPLRLLPTLPADRRLPSSFSSPLSPLRGDRDRDRDRDLVLRGLCGTIASKSRLDTSLSFEL